MKNAKKEYELWKSSEIIIKDGIFDKNEQSIFIDMFGQEETEKMLYFLKHTKPTDIRSIIIRNKKKSIE